MLSGLDPVQLSEQLEEAFEDQNALWQLYEELLALFLAKSGQEAVHFAKLLEDVDAATGVESSIRQAAFVTGFECCRQLILGEFDLEALRKGSAFKQTDGAE